MALGDWLPRIPIGSPRRCQFAAAANRRKWLAALSRVPIWAFHGAKDASVPLADGKKMVDAVKAAGGDVQFTVYPDAQHDSWNQTYDNPKVYDWLLAHRLQSQ